MSSLVKLGLTWDKLVATLDAARPDWLTQVAALEQVDAVEDRQAGRQWTDDEVFRGVVLAVLSGDTDWRRIQAILSDLESKLQGFSPTHFANLSEQDVADDLVPWLQERKAGSQSQRDQLIRLRVTADQLCELGRRYGSIDRYFRWLVHEENRGDPKAAAVALGKPRSSHKLPALGVTLAAEVLKNIGYEVAKPDRHVNRAAGSFGWVSFRNWKDRSGFKAPSASVRELHEVMRVVEDWARQEAQPVVLVDNAIWNLCSKSGLYLPNEALSALASS